MENLEDIKIRNINLLSNLIVKLKINISIEELLKGFTSIYIQEEKHDDKYKRLRLLGAKIISSENKKTKNVQLYSLKKTYLKKISLEQIEEIKLNILICIELFKELQLLKEIKKTEEIFDNKGYESCINSPFYFLSE